MTAANNGADGGSIQLLGAMRTTGSQTYTGTGTTAIGGDVVTVNANVTFGNAATVTQPVSVDVGTATAAFSSTLDIGSSSLLVSADEITVGGIVSGSGGSLTLRPGTTGAQMQIGSATTAANRLDLTPAELAFIQPGFNNITFGRGDSAAAVTVNAVGLVNPTTILAGLSPLTVAGAISSSANLALVAGSGGIAINGAVNNATHNLTLNSGGPVAQSASIVASGLELLGNASFALALPTNDVDILAVDIAGSVSFADADDLTVGIVGSTIGVATGNPGPGGTVTITASGFLTVDQTIDTSAGTGGVLTATGVVFHTVPVLGAGDIVLSGLNHAPALDLDVDDSSGQSGADFANSWTENGGPVAIADADATLVDVDNANLQSLTITITNLLDGVAESLAADTSGTSVIASYNSGTGVLTLSGIDTPAHYQQVLRTVTYDNSSEAPNPTARTITFVANDGVVGSNVGTTTLGMTAANNAPVLAGIEGTSLAYTENDPATAITASLTASDVDNTNLTGATIQITGNYQNGQDVLSFTNTGTITGNWNAATGTLTLSGSERWPTTRRLCGP